jgi:hypothetical protein
LSMESIQKKKIALCVRSSMIKSLTDVISDIEGGARYAFSIKPSNEDEQTYYPKNARKNGRWCALAFCFMAQGNTRTLIKRLKAISERNDNKLMVKMLNNDLKEM